MTMVRKQPKILPDNNRLKPDVPGAMWHPAWYMDADTTAVRQKCQHHCQIILFAAFVRTRRGETSQCPFLPHESCEQGRAAGAGCVNIRMVGPVGTLDLPNMWICHGVDDLGPIAQSWVKGTRWLSKMWLWP
jgi:hypothetical protein